MFTLVTSTAGLVYTIEASDRLIDYIKSTLPICYWAPTLIKNQVQLSKGTYYILSRSYEQKH
ncbi:hypothetical protein UFOVP181_473 [uncultured Caudovirales phage]|uniref:Uncharacterized protein n=1 Tax=uncultured Caudovirales phage TaxID=2100421 RepID=A0A6J5KWK2_9CAUD|nr:hypothetical protein UFOVP57_168 [uncultured Caudovirales phage]CAB5209430.1 hypothetical protein UFOVP181_473 [uncultured Caudovirales phage]